MPEFLQQLIVIAAVAGSVAYLILRNRRKKNCGGDCGCSVKKASLPE